MASSRTFTVSPDAVQQGKAIGLGRDAETRIARMARRAATFTHPSGNRRFEGYVLRVDQGTVTAIALLPKERVKPPEVEDKQAKKLRVEQAIALHFGRSSATR